MIFDQNNVLIVDDSLTIRHQVKLLLKKYDIEVHEAFDKPSMIHCINTIPCIDLFIMDLSLRVDSGLDCMEVIRTNPLYKNTPIIVLTGDSKRDTVLRCSQYNIAFYSVKPFISKDLSFKILTALETYNIEKKTAAAAKARVFETLGIIDPNMEEINKALKDTTMSKINKLLSDN